MSDEIINYEDYQVLQVEPQAVQTISNDAVERANIDVQVATAKHYPRNLQRAIDNSIFMATIDTETAESCRYDLPRGGKVISGPSVHLAKIIVANYGNMRTEAKVVQITDRQIISRGTAWDLENNVASAWEVRRSIIDKDGRRYKDDMITVTGNAANAIAYRNAVFSVIPRAITDKIYQAAVRKITGDLSDNDKLITRRTGCLEYYFNEYGITEEEVLKLIGRQTVNQIRAEELATLIGYYRALKDGDISVDTLMKGIRTSKEVVANKKEKMRAKKAAKDSKESANTQNPTDDAPSQTESPENEAGTPSQPTLDMP